MAQETYDSAAAALDSLPFDGMTIAAGGVGLCDIPETSRGASSKMLQRSRLPISHYLSRAYHGTRLWNNQCGLRQAI